MAAEGRSFRSRLRTERVLPDCDDLGNRTDALAANVNVEDGEFEISFLRQRFCFLNCSRFDSHVIPKLFNHLNCHHPDERFVFDEENGEIAHFGPGRL
jgi:hypothetical protein